eukprot:scaffold27860_cov27-Cyclotella_meneghiniana.AAC.1
MMLPPGEEWTCLKISIVERVLASSCPRLFGEDLMFYRAGMTKQNQSLERIENLSNLQSSKACAERLQDRHVEQELRNVRRIIQ